ncbi:unnamed protein product [Somion occarium]|uniref:Aminopeptidase n=1 Tax=Somion occarium TaxID=3059160 RepID=A0ABP1D9K1_9APHY
MLQGVRGCRGGWIQSTPSLSRSLFFTCTRTPLRRLLSDHHIDRASLPAFINPSRRSPHRPTSFPHTFTLSLSRSCSSHSFLSMSTGATAETTKDPNQYRLPTDLKPTHYDLTIHTDLEKLKFNGFITAHLEVKKATNSITFNTADLTLGSLSLTSSSLNEPYVQPASALQIDTKAERATLQLPATLPEGSTAQLKVGFQAELTGGMMGYYRSAFEQDGKTKYYSLTQFEPTAARRAFPCWDEPLLKATFAVTLISRADTFNLSNMPAESEEAYDPSASSSATTEPLSWLAEKLTGSTENWKITKFETTPPMSTYIVAFANGPFTYLESSYKSPLSGKVRPLRIYTTPDVIHQAQFALDVKEKVLPLYEQVFDIEYPLPKLDTLVATDFDAGAMENWGLITGRTSAFLLDPQKVDIGAKKQIASTQSHEVAHMWFGNITTMAWWDYLYLNEGFASLVIILNKVFPEFKVNATFISSHLNRAFSLDAKLSSHPIEVECPDANMINQIFDSLSYAKAASVLRMLSNYVGEEKFLKGVSIYLKQHLYGSSVTEDLWEGIKTATGVDIPKVMDAWVKQMGFPVVTVTETKDGIHVRQDRFLESGPALPKDNETIWTIPLSLVTVGADGKPVVDNSIVLDSREKTIPLDTSKPFKLNAGTVGVFRVLYTPERLAAIAKEAAKSKGSLFGFEDRIGLINDAPALAKAGLTEVSSALTLIDNFRNETEYLVWSSIADSIEVIVNTWWEHQHIVDLLNSFRNKLFVPIIKRLGYEYSEDEDIDTKELRTKAIVQAANAEEKSVVEELRSRFNHFLKTGDDSRIPPDLQRITFKIGAQNGGQAEWEKFASIVNKPPTPSAAIAAILALTSFKEDKYIEQTFNFIDTKSRDQDLIYFFSGLRQNFKYRKYLSMKFKESYDAYVKRTEGNFSLQYIVQFSHDSLSTFEDYKETEKFFEGKDTSKYDMTLKQTLDSIRSKALWIERSTTDLVNWLEKKQKST